MNGIASWVFTVLGVVLTAIGIWYARSQVIPGRRRQRRLEGFREVRAWMGELGSERKIVAAAHREHADLLAAAPMHLFIADPAWVLPEPIDLDRLSVEVVDETDSPPVNEERYAPLRRYWPLGSDDRPVGRYHEAVTQSGSAPRIWFNAPSYRLLGAGRRADGGFALRVGGTTYWDGYDSWAALQFEAAHQLRKAGSTSPDGPYRRSLGTPFELTNRECAIGISVLTVCLTRKGPRFYLQRRAAGRVATMGGMAGLIPAGEFQPSSAAHAALRSDADIWRCVMREFAEEFFGREDLNARAAMVDYERESPFRELDRARMHGWVRPYLLDFGFDPVSWKAGLRLVCIFDEDAYLDIFRGMLPEGEEGQLELTSLHRIDDEPLEGMPLDEATVARYLKDPTITEAARFCIGMTWRHRESLGLAAPVY